MHAVVFITREVDLSCEGGFKILKADFEAYFSHEYDASTYAETMNNSNLTKGEVAYYKWIVVDLRQLQQLGFLGELRRASEKLAFQYEEPASFKVVLESDIGELEFSPRVHKILEANGVHLVVDLVQKTPKDLLSIKGFGPTYLREVLNGVHTHDLKLLREDAYSSLFVRFWGYGWDR